MTLQTLCVDSDGYYFVNIVKNGVGVGVHYGKKAVQDFWLGSNNLGPNFGSINGGFSILVGKDGNGKVTLNRPKDAILYRMDKLDFVVGGLARLKLSDRLEDSESCIKASEELVELTNIVLDLAKAKNIELEKEAVANVVDEANTLIQDSQDVLKSLVEQGVTSFNHKGKRYGIGKVGDLFVPFGMK